MQLSYAVKSFFIFFFILLFTAYRQTGLTLFIVSNPKNVNRKMLFEHKMFCDRFYVCFRKQTCKLTSKVVSNKIIQK